MYKEDVDYKLFTFENNISGVVLNIPGYENVIYHYTKARVREEGEMAKLEFGYTIVKPGNNDIDVLTKDENFHTIMGDILKQLLMKE